MSLSNYTTNPPTLEITDHTKVHDLDLLQPGKRFPNGNLPDGHIYEIPALAKLTYALMDELHIAYRRDFLAEGETRRKLEDFSEAEKRLYLPFAFVLACLEGNAFRTGHLNAVLEGMTEPSPESITQYIPEAYHFMKANSATEEELREMINYAAGD